MKVNIVVDYLSRTKYYLSKLNACYLHTSTFLWMVKWVFYSKPNFVLDQIDAD